MRNIYIILSALLIFSCSGSSNSQVNLIESENFLRVNSSNPDVIEIEKGLQYKKIKSGGSGISPNLDDIINADFHGIYWMEQFFGAQLKMVNH